jgi:aminoglycoside phosphotransferase (APT) family kinase protein
MNGAVDPAALPAEVTRAVREAFGEAPIDHASLLRVGRSGATVAAVRVAGRSFVVRVPDPERVAHQERLARELACMAMAAERGIGPELRWAERATGITISVMIEEALVGPARALAPGRLERLAATLRALHAGPPIDGGGNVFDILRHFDELLCARRSRGIPAALDRVLREAAEGALRFGLRAPCHNDLNPANILETPSRVYLIDWETAGECDPFVDLAQIGVFGLLDDDRRAELLEAYLQRRPTPGERAHAKLARVVALGFYAVSFTTLATLTGDGAPEDVPAPRGMRDLLADLARGRARSSEIAASLMQSALREAESDAYAAALREAC